MSIVIGTRGSQLAIWQAEFIAAHLRRLYADLDVKLELFVTQGDRVLDKPLPELGGKGAFTAEIEAALLSGQIDIAVHSLKDLPTNLNPAFSIAATPERASPFDALISKHGDSLARLPHAATLGTSSLRRSAQLQAVRPDLNVIALRGNVPTRIDKAFATGGAYDAIVLAEAGLDRLDRQAVITEILSPVVMLPAPAQGALAVQCRADDATVQSLLKPLDHLATRLAVEAERAFSGTLDSGCRLPVAALAQFNQAALHLTGRVISLDGTRTITVQAARVVKNREQCIEMGEQLAAQALAQGAGELLAAIRKESQP